jgi:malignant T-cell-amplified sequence
MSGMKNKHIVDTFPYYFIPYCCSFISFIMFKRFTVAEDISSTTQLKSSVIRGIKQSITDQYPTVEEYIDLMIDKKAKVEEGKGKDKLIFIVVDGEPVFFRTRDGVFYPTLRILHKFPVMMEKNRILVDSGAIKFILGGANVMCPGITSVHGTEMAGRELPEGAPVAIYATGKEHALGIGVLKMSTVDIKSKNKGHGIETLHHLDDQLWHTPKFE